MYNNLNSISLTILLLVGVLHVDHYDYSHSNGHSICNTGCSDNDHHSFNHECGKCLTNNNKLIEPQCKESTFSPSLLSLNNLNENINYTLVYFSLYSRPPPNLI